MSWFCPLLRPQFFSEDEYIILEGDEIKSIFFMMSGKGACVLPIYNNTSYMTINEGDHFALIDIVGSSINNGFELEKWYHHKSLLES